MPARLVTSRTEEARLYSLDDFEGICRYLGRDSAATLPEQPTDAPGSRENPIDLRDARGAHDPSAKRVLVRLAVRPSNGYSLLCANLPHGIVYAHAYEATLPELQRSVIDDATWTAYDAAYEAYRSIVIEKLNAGLPTNIRRNDGRFAEIPPSDPSAFGDSPEAILASQRRPFRGALYFVEVLGDAPPIDSDHLPAAARAEKLAGERSAEILQAMREEAERRERELRTLLEALLGDRAKQQPKKADS